MTRSNPGPSSHSSTMSTGDIRKNKQLVAINYVSNNKRVFPLFFNDEGDIKPWAEIVSLTVGGKSVIDNLIKYILERKDALTDEVNAERNRQNIQQLSNLFHVLALNGAPYDIAETRNMVVEVIKEFNQSPKVRNAQKSYDRSLLMKSLVECVSTMDHILPNCSFENKLERILNDTNVVGSSSPRVRSVASGSGRGNSFTYTKNKVSGGSQIHHPFSGEDNFHPVYTSQLGSYTEEPVDDLDLSGSGGSVEDMYAVDPKEVPQDDEQVGPYAHNYSSSSDASLDGYENEVPSPITIQIPPHPEASSKESLQDRRRVNINYLLTSPTPPPARYLQPLPGQISSPKATSNPYESGFGNVSYSASVASSSNSARDRLRAAGQQDYEGDAISIFRATQRRHASNIPGPIATNSGRRSHHSVDSLSAVRSRFSDDLVSSDNPRGLGSRSARYRESEVVHQREGWGPDTTMSETGRRRARSQSPGQPRNRRSQESDVRSIYSDPGEIENSQLPPSARSSSKSLGSRSVTISGSSSSVGYNAEEPTQSSRQNQQVDTNFNEETRSVRRRAPSSSPANPQPSPSWLARIFCCFKK